MDNLNDQEFEYYKNLNLKIDERIEITRKSKEITLKWFKQLLDENDDIIIVYRPHPFEHDDKELTSLKSDYENFRIITDFSVKQWIKVADKIFTWFSTAIIECYYAGRMCNVIRPFIIDDDIDNVMYNNVNAIDTYEKFVGAVNAPDDNISDFPISQNVITEYYGKSDEILPYMRICNLLEEIRNTNIYDMPKEDAKYRIKITDILKPIIKRLVFMLKITDNTPIFNLNHKVKKWLGEFWVNIPLYQRDEVTRDEINKITDKIKEIIKNN